MTPKCPKEGQPHYGCGICNVRPFLAPPPTTNPSTTSLAEITDVYEREGLLGIQALLSRKEEEVRREEASKARSIFWLGKANKKTDEEIANDFEEHMREVGVVFDDSPLMSSK